MLGIFLFLVLSSAFNTVPAFASNATFNDDFSNGNLDKWDIVNGPSSCNTSIFTTNGSLVISIINQLDCIVNLVPKDSYWNGIGNNYIFEADMKFVSGTDHNLVFRYLPNGGVYELHFQSPGDVAINLSPNPVYITDIKKTYTLGDTFYRLKIVINKKIFQVYINDELIKDVILSEELPQGKIALRAGTGSDPSSETWFDNIIVTNLDNVPQTNLNVPLLKQTSDPWQSQIYDFANRWARNYPTIKSWGCALTSVAMVLNYHGINKLPNGTTLDPKTLNTWLKNQKDGFVGEGWINWLAISRLSKLAKSVNNISSFDALQYSRTNFMDKTKLTTDINNLIPDILEVPGHFVVAKGISGTTFNINDPSYNRLTLNDYSNSFLSMGTYTPSNTDLSYIFIYTNPNVNLTIKDSNGNSVGESYLQQSIINDNNSSSKNKPLKLYYFPQPTNGQYTLSASGNNSSNYSLDIYFYDVHGNTRTFHFNEHLNKNKIDRYILSFDKNKLKNDKIKQGSKKEEEDNDFEDELENWFKDLF